MNRLPKLSLIVFTMLILLINGGCGGPTTPTTTSLTIGPTVTTISSTTTTEKPTTTTKLQTTTITQPPSTTTTRPATTTTLRPTTTTARKQRLTLQIISVTSPVSQGANATLTAKTTPGALCDIEVVYKSGPSKAKGLVPKTAGSNGRVSWTWKVGTRTTPGTWPITVMASLNGETVTRQTSITVTD